ncbi:MAG: queuosine precursor transporter [Pseudomonadota bacterium]
MTRSLSLVLFIAAMCGIVALSNVLVQFPLQATIGPINLADLLTLGAFTYPIAFLINDLTNRRFGPTQARVVVLAGFALAVFLSIWLATPRIAIASGAAFLIAQMLDVSIFDRLRQATWWRAPFISTMIGSTIDTVLFFSLAFAASFVVLGPNDDFAIASSPLLGVFAMEAPRWVSWAIGDFAVKIFVGIVMLAPYGVLRSMIKPAEAPAGA